MYELLTLGIDEENLRYMIESNYNIEDLSEEEIIEKIELLKLLRLDDKKIKNILVGNPWYLDRCTTDVIGMINKLMEIGIDSIGLLIYDNPMLLNVDVFEIENFIKNKQEEKYTMEDIVSMIEEDSNIITE